MMTSGTEDFPKWRMWQRSPVVEVLLSGEAMATSAGLGPNVGGFDLRMTMLPPAAPVPPEAVRSAQAVVIEVNRDIPASLDRFRKLLKASHLLPVVAAVRDVSVEDVRTLLRLGATDVVPLPLSPAELDLVLQRIGSDIEILGRESGAKGRMVSIVKSVGGVGATTILTQLATMSAAREAKAGREVCLLDLDIQFGSAALYLGALPKLSLKDLLEAGNRADGALLRATAARHESGLFFVGAPPELMPLESVDPDQIAGILDLAMREFGTIFVDLPSNWTNWSVSALAQSDLILLVTELTVSSLHQTRRQLDLIQQQGMGDIPLKVVLNRVERKLFRPLNVKDAERTLGREIAQTIADDSATVSAALDQGVTLREVRAKSRVARDIAALLDGIEAVGAA